MSVEVIGLCGVVFLCGLWLWVRDNKQ